MGKKAVGKVYKSVIMANKVRNFDKTVLENPSFKDSLKPAHLLPSKPISQHPLSTVYPTRPTFRSVYSQDPASLGLHPTPSSSSSSSSFPPASSPPSDLRPSLPHPQTLPPLLFLQTLLGGASALPSTALNQELALQMITHSSHPPAQRGTAPHNLKMAFMGRRVLEMHLQMFLLQADAQRKASKLGGSILIDTQRATEEVGPVVVVVQEEEDVLSSSAADLNLVEEELVDEEEAILDLSTKKARKARKQASANFVNRDYVVLAGGEQRGDGTPGGLMDSVLSESVLGSFVGQKWKVDGVMLYNPTQHAAQSPSGSTASLQGSIVQSIFGGLSHAYGAAFTSRFFYANVLPLLEKRMPEWTWHYIEEQRMKVLQDGGIWGKQ